MGAASTIEREDLYRAAWIAGEDVVVFQITSDKRVYVAPSPRPSLMRAMDENRQKDFTGRILTSLLMLQLMFKYYELTQESPPNATIVMKYVDDCFRDFSTSSILRRADYRAMRLEESPAWDEWITHSNTTELPTETALVNQGLEPSQNVSSPLDGIAPALFWQTSTGTEPSIDCHGLSMPSYDWLFNDVSQLTKVQNLVRCKIFRTHPNAGQSL
jgi:hypothetical protein